MARLPARDAGDLDDNAREVFESLERVRGFVPELYRVAAHAPKFLPAFAEMVATSRAESALPARLKELAVLEISKLTGAQTMWDSHIALARAAGVSEVVLAGLPEWSAVAAAQEERAVLAFVDESTRSVRVSDGAWASAAAALTSEQLAELVFVAAFYNMVARILEPLQIDRDPRYSSPGQ